MKIFLKKLWVVGFFIGSAVGYFVYSLLMPVLNLSEVIDGDLFSFIFVNYPVIITIFGGIIGGLIGHIIGKIKARMA